MALQHLRNFKQQLLTVPRMRDDLIDGLRLKLERLLVHWLNLEASPKGVVLYNEDTSTWSLTVDASATNAAIDISGTLGSADDRMLDGNGRLVEFGAIGTFAGLETNAKTYLVGGLAVDVPDRAVEVAPSSGVYNYDRFDQIAGISGTPDGVTDNGGGVIELIVDSIMDSGEGDCSALTDTLVRVYLQSVDYGGAVGPQGTSGWFEDCAIIWDGTNNVIRTTTYLGQSSPSTTTTDYVIVALGPIVRREATGLPTGAAQFAKYDSNGPGSPVDTVIDWRNARENGDAIRTMPTDGGGDHFELITRRNVAGGPRCYAPGLVYVATADSSTISNTAVETDFDESYQFAADTLAPGTVLRVTAWVDVLGVNSGDLTAKLYIGGYSVSATITGVGASDAFWFRADFVQQSDGAAGAYRVTVQRVHGTFGLPYTGNINVSISAGTHDTTATQDVKVSATWTVAHADNQCALRQFIVEAGRYPST